MCPATDDNAAQGDLCPAEIPGYFLMSPKYRVREEKEKRTYPGGGHVRCNAESAHRRQGLSAVTLSSYGTYPSLVRGN